MKSANVTVRVEPDVKEKAEAILSELGIPTSTAINTWSSLCSRTIWEWASCRSLWQLPFLKTTVSFR